MHYVSAAHKPKSLLSCQNATHEIHTEMTSVHVQCNNYVKSGCVRK
jgi:hypothetical protein